MFGRKKLTVDVSGLTCAHCQQHVTDALSGLEGVKKAEVDLVPNGVSHAHVTYSGEVSDADITAAVADAGYEVVTITR
ncbi:MAG: heavy metal-associated domain-containing protein [Actinomycetaceae bacterium]|nr:heavy metal-associated domain-containing protein [Actinomycetaceae bacterium]MDU0969968.1 heavy metal-associated domain-containing protein [Actinomycetaceae bacterium]